MPAIEIIYKACARSMVQIVYSSFFLFLFYLLFGRFIEVVRYAMPYVYSGLIFFITLKTQRAVKELHLEKDDKSELILKTYSKAQIKFRSWIVFIGSIFGTLTYGFLSLQEEKTPKNTKQEEKSNQ